MAAQKNKQCLLFRDNATGLSPGMHVDVSGENHSILMIKPNLQGGVIIHLRREDPPEGPTNRASLV
jgi:hypothetical protein